MPSFAIFNSDDPFDAILVDSLDFLEKGLVKLILDSCIAVVWIVESVMFHVFRAELDLSKLSFGLGLPRIIPKINA